MKKVACIGVGNVGRAWAVVFARSGLQVSLFDADSDAVRENAIPAVEETLALLSSQGFLTEPVTAVLERIEPADSLEAAVSDADYIQESVREDVEIKRAVFAEIGVHAPGSALLASSTSAIMGSEFLGNLPAPERALVAHPVNPPSLIPLVELCGTKWTAQKTLDRAGEFLEQVGMRPILVRKEIDGFILNRLQYTLVAEAMHLVGEGYCSPEDIDRVMTDGLALRWASIGPFATAHLNASAGFQGFVDQLGPMMKKMGRDAKTNYDWGDGLAKEIHAAIAKGFPVSEIDRWQRWRDQRILATRVLQEKP